MYHTEIKKLMIETTITTKQNVTVSLLQINYTLLKIYFEQLIIV
jgi:hypothetical protein